MSKLALIQCFTFILFGCTKTSENNKIEIPQLTDLQTLNLKGAIKSVFEVEIDSTTSKVTFLHDYKTFNNEGGLVGYGTWENTTDSLSKSFNLQKIKPYQYHDANSMSRNVWIDTLCENIKKTHNKKGLLTDLLVYFNADKKPNNVSKKYSYQYSEKGKLTDFKFYAAAKDTADTGYEQKFSGEPISDEYIDYVAWTAFEHIQFNDKGFPIFEITKDEYKPDFYLKKKYNYTVSDKVKQTLLVVNQSNRGQISDSLLIWTPFVVYDNDFQLMKNYTYKYAILNDTIGNYRLNDKKQLIFKEHYFNKGFYKDSVAETFSRIYKNDKLVTVRNEFFNIDSSDLYYETNDPKYLKLFKEYVELIQFNEHGDITSEILKNLFMKRGNIDLQINYIYDNQQNWVLKREVLNHRKVKITKRKIVYYK